MINLTQKYLKECFNYDADTGILYWKNRPRDHFTCDKGFKGWNTRFVGKKAGNISVEQGRGLRYSSVKISTVLYKAHRIIWVIAYGYWPDKIDHIDGNGLNNRLDNLRSVSNSKNHMNRKKAVDNTSGVTGVHWHKQVKKWNAFISINGVQTSLGCFSDIADAISVRQNAEIKYGYHANHGRVG